MIRTVAQGPGGTLLIGSDGEHVTSFGSWTAMGITRLEPDGDLDHTWNVSGTVVRNWRTSPDENDFSFLRAMYVESDGGLLIAGHFYNSALGTDHAAVGRLTPTGAFDTGFGTSGRKFFKWDSLPDTWGSQLIGIARLADGGILTAGNFVLGSPTGIVQFGTAKLTEIGGTDTNYGFQGLTYNAYVSSPVDSLIATFTIDAAGRAVVAGRCGSTTDGLYAVARFLPDGGLDPKYKGTGSALYGFGPGGLTRGAQALALHLDGGILLAGDIAFDNGSDTVSTMVVMRLEGGLPFRDGFESASRWFWDLP
jgi:uncharacterized delta-60 repeat protein